MKNQGFLKTIAILGATAVVTLIVLAGPLTGCTKSSNSDRTPTYVITETHKYSSLDPIDADDTHNLAVQRMLYSTPLEVSPTDDYTSFILDKFVFDKEQKLLTFEVKKDVIYSDGQKLTPTDITLAIKRLVKKSPDFPVVGEILGIRKWLESGANLKSHPEGIVINGNEVKITFKHVYNSPFARFAMENFSVIPSSCVDLSTGKLKCETIPSSGPYVLSNETENSILFIRNPKFKTARSLPNEILFRYEKASTLFSSEFKMSDYTVISSTEEIISPYEKNELSSFKLKKKAASRFSAIVIFDTPVFSDVKIRKAFANEYRKAFEGITGHVTTSMFPKIVSGYKKFEPYAVGEVLASEKVKIRWAHTKSNENSLHSKTLEVINKSSKLFEILPPVVFDTVTEYKEAVKNKELDLMRFTCGFWPIDPSGDVRMMLSPGLHLSFDHLTNDNDLKDLLSQMKKAPTHENLAKINEYLYSKAQINVYNHTARLYLFNESSGVKHLPMGITSPAPYTVMEAALQ